MAEQQPAASRVAVIAVHGVGDPGAGKTASNLAEFLLNLNGQPQRTAIYETFKEQDLQVPVRPLVGLHGHFKVPPSTSRFDDRGGYIRARQKLHKNPQGLEDVAPDVGFSLDMVSGLSDEGPDAVYSSSCRSTVRKSATTQLDIDLYELYWADLVRLGTGAVRALGEIYQIMLHLPSIGQRELDMARAVCKQWWWKWYDHLQDLAVRTLTLPLPIFNLLILVLALTSIPLKVAEKYPKTAYVTAMVVLIAAGTVIGGWIAYKFASRQIIGWLSLPIACGLSAALVSYFAVLPPAANPARVISIEWLIAAAVCLHFVIRAYSRRRPGAGIFAVVTGALTTLGLIIAILITTNDRPGMLNAVFEVVAVLWVALAVSWMILWFLTLAAGLWGLYIVYRETVHRDRAWKVTRTLRLTLALPTVMFFVMTLTLWAAIRFADVHLVLLPDVKYAPPPWIARLSRTFHLVSKTPPANLSDFGRHLVTASGSVSFPVVLGALAIACVLAIYALLVPVLGDVRVPDEPARQARKYGAWLNNGDRLLELTADWIFLTALSIVPLNYLFSNLFHWRNDLLNEFGLLVAGMTAALFASGRLDSVASTLGPILTAILDVDAYLRLHPCDSNPRGRIFTRYVSLLRHVCRSGRKYDRVLIVSHSQGTVITADLFRFLKAFPDPALSRLGFGIKGCDPHGIPIQLLTAGCPLRQLYGRRFPFLYEWAIGAAGPDPNGLCVKQWVNVYRTGDYVGRWLWRTADTLQPDIVDHPPPKWGRAARGRIGGQYTDPQDQKREMNIGAGAHVRYFDDDAPAVAYLIDDLLAELHPPALSEHQPINPGPGDSPMAGLIVAATGITVSALLINKFAGPGC